MLKFEICSPRRVKHYLCLHMHYLNHTLLVDLEHKNTTTTERKITKTLENTQTTHNGTRA